MAFGPQAYRFGGIAVPLSTGRTQGNVVAETGAATVDHQVPMKRCAMNLGGSLTLQTCIPQNGCLGHKAR